MLKEIEHARQNKGEPFRRIFNGDKLSLILWYESDEVVAYQLTYQLEKEELSLRWDKDKGLSHQVIDDGESRSFRYKMSQVLSNSKALNKEYLAKLLKGETAGLELKGVSLILTHLESSS